MTPSRFRRLVVTSLAVSALLASALVSSPAAAAPYSGHLELKGPGSVYSPGPDTLVAEAVSAVPGTASYEIKVVNTGTQITQFNIRIPAQGFGATSNLYSGSLLLSPMSSGPDGYWTAPIAPGKYQALVLKVTVSQSYPTQQLTYVDLRAADGTYLGRDTVATQIKAEANGYGATVFARQGSQPFVGGPFSTDEIASSPALNTGQSATFNVKLQNFSESPQPVRARMFYGSGFSCHAVTVKDGSVDVTSKVTWQDNYSTPVLAPGAVRNLTVTVKRVPTLPCSRYVTFTLNTFFANFSAPPDSMRLLVPTGPV